MDQIVKCSVPRNHEHTSVVESAEPHVILPAVIPAMPTATETLVNGPAQPDVPAVAIDPPMDAVPAAPASSEPSLPVPRVGRYPTRARVAPSYLKDYAK